MRDLKSMTLEEMTEALKAMGQPAFRGKQVFTWLHKGVTSFDEMTNLPAALRDTLALQAAARHLPVHDIARHGALVVPQP